jgi:plasmid stabilization system protein ParE
MKLAYSRRALSDIDAIATYYSTRAHPAIAKIIERRLLDVIERIRRNPESAPRVAQRSKGAGCDRRWLPVPHFLSSARRRYRSSTHSTYD